MEYKYFNDDRFKFKVSTETCIHTPHSFFHDGSIWEQASLRQFYTRIDPTKKCTIVDIGAQSGLYTLYAKFLPLAQYHSFEPFPTTFNLLNQNIALNGITNVQTYNLGISDYNGEAILQTCKSHNGLHTLGTSPKRFSDIVPVPIRVATLDSMFYDRSIPVDYIKIDTEGGEYNILKGAEKTIRAYKPAIQLEWNLINMSQAHVTEDMLSGLLKDYGYVELSMVEEEKYFIPS